MRFDKGTSRTYLFCQFCVDWFLWDVGKCGYFNLINGVKP